MRPLTVAALGFALASAALPAHAQDARVEGSWSFETRPYLEGTRIMRGDAYFYQKEDGTWSCQFTTGEYYTAELQNEGAEPFATSEQVCTLRQVNNAITIRSEVVNASSLGYYPDNFDLRLIDADTMHGRGFSWAPMGSVTFRRVITAIS